MSELCGLTGLLPLHSVWSTFFGVSTVIYLNYVYVRMWWQRIKFYAQSINAHCFMFWGWCKKIFQLSLWPQFRNSNRMLLTKLLRFPAQMNPVCFLQATSCIFQFPIQNFPLWVHSLKNFLYIPFWWLFKFGKDLFYTCYLCLFFPVALSWGSGNISKPDKKYCIFKVQGPSLPC